MVHVILLPSASDFHSLRAAIPLALFYGFWTLVFSAELPRWLTVSLVLVQQYWLLIVCLWFNTCFQDYCKSSLFCLPLLRFP